MMYGYIMKNTIAILTLLASFATTAGGSLGEVAPAKSPVIEPAPDVKLRVETFMQDT